MTCRQPPHIARRLAFVVFACLLGTACGGGGDEGADAVPTLTPAPVVDDGGSGGVAAPSGLWVLNASTSCGLPDFRAGLLQQINAARATGRTCGGTAWPAVRSLEWNDLLFSASAKHAADMALNGYFDHTSLDGRTLGQRVTAEGYNWRAVGENIAAGQSSVSAVMQGWLSSAGHCRNLMSSNFNDVGVACVVAARGTPYWVMKLGAR